MLALETPSILGCQILISNMPMAVITHVTLLPVRQRLLDHGAWDMADKASKLRRPTRRTTTTGSIGIVVVRISAVAGIIARKEQTAASSI
jgi:hypothetical protein